jgi:hypothetical protein
MHLPENLTMMNTAHGHGDKGMAFYTYEDADGLGVLLDARRKDGRSPFVETWRFRWLPYVEARTYNELRDAVGALCNEEQVADQKAKWPQMPKPPAPSLGGVGRCWLHTDRPRTHSGWVQTSWHQFDGLTAMLCDECAAAAATDPTGIVRASEARRADVAARKTGLASIPEVSP